MVVNAFTGHSDINARYGNIGWPGSDSCSFPSLVVLTSSCPFGDVFSLLNHIASALAFAIWFNGHLPYKI